MGHQWVIWLLGILWVLFRIVQILRKEKHSSVSPSSPKEIWETVGKVCVVLLVGGIVLVSIRPENNFMITLYHERFWVVLIGVFLVTTFWLGSFLQQRLAGVTGVLVFGFLEAYSALVVYPSFRWILTGYAAFCFGLCLFGVSRKLHPHGAHQSKPGH